MKMAYLEIEGIRYAVEVAKFSIKYRGLPLEENDFCGVDEIKLIGYIQGRFGHGPGGWVAVKQANDDTQR